MASFQIVTQGDAFPLSYLGDSIAQGIHLLSLIQATSKILYIHQDRDASDAGHLGDVSPPSFVPESVAALQALLCTEFLDDLGSWEHPGCCHTHQA